MPSRRKKRTVARGQPERVETGALKPRKRVKQEQAKMIADLGAGCLLYTSPSPRDGATSRMPSSA